MTDLGQRLVALMASIAGLCRRCGTAVDPAYGPDRETYEATGLCPSCRSGL